MPKKLKVSSNERIDLDDFSRASSDYTQESGNFSREKLMQARRSLVSGGFRIEVSDQAASPGQFTIYNGVALDKSGNILNNEQQVADARTLTLPGAGLPFYVEVEFVESDSDVDSRAFWDPTFSGNTPPGKEFSLNVATRRTPDWQVASPVSTTGFDVDTNVNSTKIPIAVLYTDGSNEISGYTAVNFATVLEEDAPTAPPTTQLRVLDSTLFPTTGTATLGLGTAASESVNITANDRINGILTISPAASNEHLAGAILKDISTTAAFLPEDTDAVPAAPGASTSADQRRGLFAGDETRGSALTASDQDAATRSDLAVKSLKDHVDFLSAQIRELKYGNFRTGQTTTPDPSFSTTDRYYDYSGSIAGVRSWNYTIGDAVSSLGDFNAASDDFGTQLQAAHDALDATDGGAILIKEGDYVWDATVTVTKPVSIVFAEGVSFVAGTYASIPISIGGGVKVELIGMPAVPATELPFPVTAQNFDFIELIGVNSTLQVDFTAATTVNNSTFQFTDCVFPAESSAGAFKTNNGTAQFYSKMLFNDCLFQHNDSVDLTTEAIVDVQLSNASFENCVFDLAAGSGSANQLLVVNDVHGESRQVFSRCRFIESNSGSGKALNPIDTDSNNSGYVEFNDCYFELTWAATTATEAERTFVRGDLLRLNSCEFENFDVPDSADTNQDTFGVCVKVLTRGYVDKCSFDCGDDESFNCAVVTDGQASAFITSCHFNNFYRSIFSETATRVKIIGNNFNNSHAFSNLLLTEMIAVDCRVGQNFGGTQILDNNFYYSINTVDESFRYTSIKVRDLDLPSAYVDIKNNAMQFIPITGEVCGIQLSDIGKISGYGRVNVIGNDIHMPQQAFAGQASSYWGIRSDQTGSFFLPHFDWIISNNSIRMIGDSDTGDTYGIEIVSADSYEKPGTGIGLHAGYLINDNNIVCDNGSSTGDVVGIKFTGVGAQISNNSIAIEGGTSSATSGGVIATGHWITILGNMIQVDATAAAVNVDVGSRANFDTGHYSGFLSVTNNTIISQLTVGVAVSVFSNEGQSSCLSIDGNTIHAEHATTNASTFISLISNGSGGGGFSISNNKIWEVEEPATGSTRSAINLSVTGVVTKGAVINGNVIASPNFNFGALRGASSSAIQVFGDDDLQGLAVCNNVIQGWVDLGQANRRSIDINDVYGVTVVGNSCAYSGVAGEPVIRVDSCTNVLISANEADNYNILTSTSADVTTTGSNNGTIV